MTCPNPLLNGAGFETVYCDMDTETPVWSQSPSERGGLPDMTEKGPLTLVAMSQSPSKRGGLPDTRHLQWVTDNPEVSIPF